LYSKSRHYNAFQDHLTKVDPAALQGLAMRTGKLVHHGMAHKQSIKGGSKLLVEAVNKQGQIRFAMDYYEWMALMLIGVILLIAIFPSLNKTVVYLKNRRLTPA
jgi:hypothetical protein